MGELKTADGNTSSLSLGLYIKNQFKSVISKITFFLIDIINSKAYNFKVGEEYGFGNN